jgi:hypothetical protein
MHEAVPHGRTVMVSRLASTDDVPCGLAAAAACSEPADGWGDKGAGDVGAAHSSRLPWRESRPRVFADSAADPARRGACGRPERDVPSCPSTDKVLASVRRSLPAAAAALPPRRSAPRHSNRHGHSARRRRAASSAAASRASLYRPRMRHTVRQSLLLPMALGSVAALAVDELRDSAVREEPVRRTGDRAPGGVLLLPAASAAVASAAPPLARTAVAYVGHSMCARVRAAGTHSFLLGVDGKAFDHAPARCWANGAPGRRAGRGTRARPYRPHQRPQPCLCPGTAPHRDAVHTPPRAARPA